MRHGESVSLRQVGRVKRVRRLKKQKTSIHLTLAATIYQKDVIKDFFDHLYTPGRIITNTLNSKLKEYRKVKL
jgi:hypothetical protein